MYDVAILGGGPAGITAAIYSARYRLNTLLLSPQIGGWASKAHMIENFPSHVSVLGRELKRLYQEHVKANDISYKREKVKSVEKGDDGFRIKTNKGEHLAKYVIYALGTKKRKINVPGEDEFLGKGVCLCATCDAPFFKGKDVAVIGGNDSGTTSALLLAEYANSVHIIEILDKLPTEPIWTEKIENEPKIKVITGDSVREIKGNGNVSSITLNSNKEIPVDGVFIEVGSIPDTSAIDKLGLKKDRWGHICIGADQQTSIDRIYAAGDITNGSNYMRQIVAAQAEGAIAAQAIYKRAMKGE
jgi:thioredoxin reductase (NADPH)